MPFHLQTYGLMPKKQGNSLRGEKAMSRIAPFEENTIVVGDCLGIIKNLPNSCIDLIVTDPPYNVSQKGVNISRGALFGQGGPIKLDFGDWDYSSIVPMDYLDEFIRLLTPVGVLVLFYDKLYLGMIGLYLEMKFGFQTRHIGSYVKTNPAPQARKVKWQNGVENFLVATKNKGIGHHFNYKLGQSPDYFIRSVNYERIHPTQKPEDLIEWIVSYWSFEGDLVFDSFIGSGTTAIAADRLGRKFFGCDINSSYVEMALNRLANDRLKRSQLGLFSDG